jgi:tRNA A-37 threonylcarbamoyl transferase component Bud32
MDSHASELELRTTLPPNPSGVSSDQKETAEASSLAADSRPTPSVSGEQRQTKAAAEEVSPSRDAVLLQMGPYEVLGELARGGMGIVYKARHVALGRVVALKSLLADTADHPLLQQRFEREARAVARLRHAHIVPIYEVGRHEDRPYFTMAYIPGGSLAQHRRRFQADPRAAAALLVKIARAVQHAHERGILHRDLKPGNVLLDEHDEPLVSDFGLAKVLDDDVELTNPGDLLGTPLYMSPEQAAGSAAEVGPAADIWALGVILYELLTGQRPFPGPGRGEVARQVRRDEPARPTTLRSDLDTRLEALVLRCLAKRPEERYRTAGLLADDLERWLRGEQAAGLQEQERKRSWGISRRSWLAGTMLLLGGAGSLVFVLGGHRPVAGTVDAPGEQEVFSTPPVILIGESGPPADFHRTVTRPEVRTGLHSGDRTFFVQAPSCLCLLGLGSPPPWPSFRFEAEVRHEESTGGEVGIYFAHHLDLSPREENHFCFPLGFADKGPFPGHATLRLTRIQLPSWQENQAVCISPAPFKPSGNAGAVWRKVAIEVTPSEARVYWKDDQERCIGRLPREEAQSRIADVRGSYHPRGGVGLYVRSSSASFRRVFFTRLPDSEKE